MLKVLWWVLPLLVLRCRVLVKGEGQLLVLVWRCRQGAVVALVRRCSLACR